MDSPFQRVKKQWRSPDARGRVSVRFSDRLSKNAKMPDV